MDKNLLKEIVIEQNEIPPAPGDSIRRDKLRTVSKYQSLPHALIISGIRRCGKSTLLKQIIEQFYKDQTYYFSFEDERLIHFGINDFNHLYQIFIELFGDKQIFLLDEIQNVGGWENFVRKMQDRGFKFIITGSNAALLSKELGTKLTGRSIMLELYPFSFGEFLRFKQYPWSKEAFYHTKARGKLKKYFNEYLKNGGMPEYLKYQDKIILKQIYEDILYRDIAARYKIKEIKALRELTLYLLSNIAGLFSFNKLKQILNLGSANTVKSYVDYLENSFLIFTSRRFSYSLKQQFVAPKKIYAIDNGLIEAVAFQFSKNRGKYLENLVFLELRRRNSEVYYYLTKNNFEVDFLIKQGRYPVELIQVTENLNNPAIRQRETRALIEAMDELKLKKALVLTEDEEEEIQIDNKKISVKSIYKWLLQ